MTAAVVIRPQLGSFLVLRNVHMTVHQNDLKMLIDPLELGQASIHSPFIPLVKQKAASEQMDPNMSMAITIFQVKLVGWR